MRSWKRIGVLVVGVVLLMVMCCFQILAAGSSRVNGRMPNTKDANLTKIVRADVEKYVEEFEKTAPPEATLTYEYETYQPTDDIVSCVVNYFIYDDPSRGDFQVVVYNYDVKNQKMLTLEDVFRGRYLNYFSSEATLFYGLSEKVYPSEENFKNFLLTKDSVRFYLDQSLVKEGKSQYYYTFIPYANLDGFVKIDYLGQNPEIVSEMGLNDLSLRCVRGPLDLRIPMVAIAFDNATSEQILEITDILSKESVVANFFLNENCTDREAIVAILSCTSRIEMAMDENTSDPFAVSKQIIGNAIKYDDELIEENHVPTVIHVNGDISSKIETLGYPIVQWTVDTDGTKLESGQFFDETLQDGDIIHITLNEHTLEVLPEMLRELKAKGYQTASLLEMMKLRGYDTSSGGIYQSLPKQY